MSKGRTIPFGPTRRRRAYTVAVTLPKGVTERQMQAYIREAVRTYAGALESPVWDLGVRDFVGGDPLFRLNPNTVTVSKAFR